MKMRKTVCTIFLYVAVMASCGLAAAQDHGIDSLYERFSGESGYTSVTYGSRMLKMMKEGGSEQLQGLLDNLDVIRVISTSKFCRELETSARRVVEKDCYELISEVRDGGCYSAFYFKDEPSGKSSFIMIVADRKSATVLDIYGKFEVNEISRLMVVPDTVLGEKRKDKAN